MGLYDFLIKEFMKLRAVESVLAKRTVADVLTRRAFSPSLRGRPHIVPTIARQRLDAALRNRSGGVDVIVGPPASGKSTNLRFAFNEFLANGGKGAYFGIELKSYNQFFDLFGGSQRTHDLIKIMPRGTAIVIDQFEEHDEKAMPDMLNLVKDLMFESTLVENISITVATSDAACAQRLLDLNGGRKVRLGCHPSDFRWTSADVDSFIKGVGSLGQLNEPTLHRLRDLAITSGSAGFLSDVANYSESEVGGPTRPLNWMEARAQGDSRSWSSYEKLLDSPAGLPSPPTASAQLA